MVIESPEALISGEERAAAAANNTDQVPNPLAWLPPELPPHVKVSGVTATQKLTKNIGSLALYAALLWSIVYS